MRANKRCVLVVDDEMKMLRAIKDFLTANRFIVLEATDGEQAIDLYYENSSEIDLILLDVMMPKMSGYEVLERLRMEASLVPIIMVTAKGEEYDQIKGFSLGADDYVCKPFSPTLLLARMESVLKRVGKSLETELNCGGIQLNIESRIVSCEGKEQDLTKREFDLLQFFMSNVGLTFSREQILNSVWGYEFEGDIRTVDTHIKQLRVKFQEASAKIITMHRVGYKFENTK